MPRNDFYRFSAAANTWTALPTGSAPSARYGMGFASTPDGMLYVFGGFDGTGNQAKERRELESGLKGLCADDEKWLT